MKVALVEISGSHAECLPAQLILLKEAGHEVELIHHSGLDGLSLMIPLLAGHHEVSQALSAKQRVNACVDLLHKGEYQLCIFNTAQGRLMKKICRKRLPKGRRIGILHHVEKLRKVSAQRLIDMRLDGYLVLSEYLCKEARIAKPKMNLSWFYPMFFFPSDDEVHKENHEQWIGIPGQVEYKRRDYAMLIKSLSETRPEKSWRFILLGPMRHAHGDGPRLMDELHVGHLQRSFVTFDKALPYSRFHALVKHCDLILPLIPEQSARTDYKRNQISGSWNLAFAYDKPLLLPKSMSSLVDFKEGMHFYESGNLIEGIKDCMHSNQKRGPLTRFSQDFQRKQYLSFVVGGS